MFYFVFLVISHGYYLFFGLHKEHWFALDRALTDAKAVSKEQKDNSPSSEASNPSPRTSTSKEKDKERPGDEQEDYKETTEEDKDEYECVVS